MANVAGHAFRRQIPGIDLVTLNSTEPAKLMVNFYVCLFVCFCFCFVLFFVVVVVVLFSFFCF